MDTSDLIVFASPKPMNTLRKTADISSSGHVSSDDLLTKSVETGRIKQISPFKSPESSLETRPQGLLCPIDLNVSDFGKESLGILPENFRRQSFDLLNLSARDSIGLMNLSGLDIGKESLGILHTSLIGRESGVTPRESLGFLNVSDLGRESLAFGRESLGILQLNTELPDIFLTSTEDKTVDNISTGLNTAFLRPSPRKGSTFSSSSSINSVNYLFNSKSFEEPSKIYSLSAQKNFEFSLNSEYPAGERDAFNDAFYSSTNSKFKYSSSSISSVFSSQKSSFTSRNTFNGFRSRIQSLPVTLEESFMEKPLDRRSLGALHFCAETNEFMDSVFIEANHIAEKIADGTIYEEGSANEANILDSTPQPDWPEDPNESTSEEKPKSDTQTVFKTVDKMLPNPIQTDVKLKFKSSRSDSTSSNENSNVVDKSMKCNLSKISNASEKNASRLLKNLSDILHETDSLSKSQRTEGENLIHSLADILCDTRNKITNSEDSGNSSIIEEQKHGDKEIVSHSSEQEKALDLSIKKTIVLDTHPNIVVPLILKTSNSSSFDANRSTVSNISGGSNDSKNRSGNRSSNLPSVAGKLRPTKATYSIGLKKGPLKAVIPIGDMERKLKEPTTPKTEPKVPNVMHSKRTSTPIQEPKLKPMAASTPTNRPIKEQKECAVSPLARPRHSSFSSVREITELTPRTLTHEKNFSSASKPINKSLSKIDSKLVRRNSATEIQKTTMESSSDNPKLKRSYSMGKESKIMSALSKVRQNILNSPYYHPKGKIPGANNNNTVGLSENKVLPRMKTDGVKATNLPMKVKKVGKENIEN